MKKTHQKSGKDKNENGEKRRSRDKNKL